jgi:cytochrome b561
MLYLWMIEIFIAGYLLIWVDGRNRIVGIFELPASLRQVSSSKNKKVVYNIKG